MAQRASAELVLGHAVEPAVLVAAPLGYGTLGPSFDLTLEAGGELLHDAALEVTMTEPRLRVAVGPPVQAPIDVADPDQHPSDRSALVLPETSPVGSSLPLLRARNTESREVAVKQERGA